METKTEDDDELELTSEKKAWMWVAGMMFVMGGASHLLVEASLSLGDMLGIDAVIMGFVVIAAGTSVPDTALSVISAKKGHYDAAVSNVFGSNIFDICICLSIPILLALAMSGEATAIDLPQLGLIWSLIGATFLAVYFFWSNNYTLTKFKAGTMGMLYLLIIFVSFSFINCKEWFVLITVKYDSRVEICECVGQVIPLLALVEMLANLPDDTVPAW